jgi:hypothetical protein
MNKLLLISLVVLVLVFSGCAGATQENTNAFNFIFKYDVSGGNTLDTFKGTYTRDMILDPAVTIDMTLTADEMNTVQQKMLEIDFFNYPDRFSIQLADNATITQVMPYPTYFFKVAYEGKTKELLWHAKHVNADPPADKLKELINLIIGIIESKPEYQALPKPSGGYL